MTRHGRPTMHSIMHNINSPAPSNHSLLSQDSRLQVGHPKQLPHRPRQQLLLPRLLNQVSSLCCVYVVLSTCHTYPRVTHCSACYTLLRVTQCSVCCRDKSCHGSARLQWTVGSVLPTDGLPRPGWRHPQTGTAAVWPGSSPVAFLSTLSTHHTSGNCDIL